MISDIHDNIQNNIDDYPHKAEVTISIKILSDTPNGLRARDDLAKVGIFNVLGYNKDNCLSKLDGVIHYISLKSDHYQ
jgi:hypothetical protein